MLGAHLIASLSITSLAGKKYRPNTTKRRLVSAVTTDLELIPSSFSLQLTTDEPSPTSLLTFFFLLVFVLPRIPK